MLGYWSSDDISQGGSSASCDPESLKYDDVNGWWCHWLMSGAAEVDDWGNLIFPTMVDHR